MTSSPSTLTLGVLAGQWSTNVGNAFFQLGARRLLEEAAPGARIVWLPELPGYQWTGRQNPPGALDPAAWWQVDALVALGPFFRPEFEQILLPTLESARERGVPVLTLGTGMMDYSADAVRRYVSLLRRTDIRFMATRDRRAFELLSEGGVDAEIFDGVDVAFWVSEAVPPTPIAPAPDVVLNFDKEPEPDFAEHPDGDIEIAGRRWSIRPGALGRRLARSGRVGQFLSTWMPTSDTSTLDGACRVLRTDHRFNPIVVRRPIVRPDTLWTDLPEPYLNLYAATPLTLSNRVHACAATLAYGNAAMLFSPSPRAALLERVGAGDIRERPVTIDLDMLGREKAELRSALSRVLAEIEPDHE